MPKVAKKKKAPSAAMSKAKKKSAKAAPKKKAKKKTPTKASKSVSTKATKVRENPAQRAVERRIETAHTDNHVPARFDKWQ